MPNNCNHIMLDLETLSTRKDAAIIQIAARAFDPETGELGAEFCAFIKNPTGHVDVQTVAWWMQQVPAAAIGAAVASDDAYPELRALECFASWLGMQAPAGGWAELWSHGATFDIVLLENAYTRNGLAKPWSYRVERDTRTLYAHAPGGMPTVPQDPQRKHDARYDCEVQIKQVVGALAALRYVSNLAHDVSEALADTQRAAANADEQTNRRISDALSRAERAETAANDLRSRLRAHDDPPVPGGYRGQGPRPSVDVLTCAVASGMPSPAVPTALPYDPPPVWSNAESYTEAFANPDCSPPSSH